VLSIADVRRLDVTPGYNRIGCGVWQSNSLPSSTLVPVGVHAATQHP
jgi:hypothetical protein